MKVEVINENEIVVEGKYYEAVESDGNCTKCDFNYPSEGCSSVLDAVRCIDIKRKDKRFINWRLKEKFTIKEIIGNKIVVNCKTLDDTKEFLKLIKEDGYSNSSEADHYFNYPSNGNIIGEDLSFNLNEGRDYPEFDNLKFWNTESYKVITFDQLKKESKMKYELVKDLSGKEIAERACKDEFEIFVNKFGFHNDVAWTKENEDYIRSQNSWISFLKENSYIEDSVEKIIYDSSKVYIVAGRFKLCIVNNAYNFIDLNSTFERYITDKQYGQEAIDYVVSRNYKLEVFNHFKEVADKYYR